MAVTTTMHTGTDEEIALDDGTLGPPIRVVMADDDKNDHLLLLMAAEAAGIRAEFEFVDDGSELLLRLAQFESVAEFPDLIVLDLRMPGIDGHRTLEVLQDHPVLWQIPVVVFTSSTRRVDEILSFERGARWVDIKPSDFNGMVAFASRLTQRANSVPYRADDDKSETQLEQRLSALRADTIAEIEDELLYRLPEL